MLTTLTGAPICLVTSGHVASNPRIGMIYGNWDRMGEERQVAVLETARRIIDDPDAL